MRIGILAPSGVGAFKEYFSNDLESLSILEANSSISTASAIVTLVKGFINQGHFVRLFTLCDSNFYIQSDHLEIVGVKRSDNYFIKYSVRVFVDSFYIKKALKNKIDDLDVLHAHWTYEFAYAVRDSTIKLPVFCTIRDYAPYIWKIESLKNKVFWSFKYIMNEIVFRSESIRFVANSPYTQALIREKYKIEAPIIPNPIKSSFLKKSETCMDGDPLRILCVSSSIDRRKNILILLLAFRELRLLYPSARLTLVGSPFSIDNPIVEKWNMDGLLVDVDLVGGVGHDKLIKYYDESTIFVSPSLEETFGNTLLEAMARKIPIVAGQRSGAIPYVLRDGKAGFLCDVSKVKDLVDTISYVFSHKEITYEKVNWAFNMLSKEYLDDIICKNHIELFKSVL